MRLSEPELSALKEVPNARTLAKLRVAYIYLVGEVEHIHGGIELAIYTTAISKKEALS
jgi:hypothetical protein